MLNEVGDIEVPKEGRKTVAFRQTFEDLDVGGVVGETVEDAVHEGVVECVDALTEVKGDIVSMKADEELVAGDGRCAIFLKTLFVRPGSDSRAIVCPVKACSSSHAVVA
jgi:hypothetical protein